MGTNYFNTDNTDGFDQETLDQMNEDFDKEIVNLDPDFDQDEIKAAGDRIFNRYC